jgi:hypothetical protein
MSFQSIDLKLLLDILRPLLRADFEMDETREPDCLE